MQVIVENIDQFSRRMTVTIEDVRIEREVQDRLIGMLSTVKISGFRQGKVPLKIVKDIYSKSTRSKVINSLIQNSMREAITNNKISVAGEPHVETIKEDGKNIIYKIIYEIFPEVQEVKIDNLCVEKIVSAVQNKDVLTMLNKLREQHSSWEPSQFAAKIKNGVKIDFCGNINGKKFDGSDGSDVFVVIGSGSMPFEFEEQLVGKKAGENMVINMMFSDNHDYKSLQGKEVSFEVTVKSVSKIILPTLDDNFAALCGYSGGFSELKEQVVSNMKIELITALNIHNKQKIMNLLIVSNELNLPKIFIEDEARHLMKEESHNRSKQGIDVSNILSNIDNFRNLAKRRVSLSLLINKIVNDNNIGSDKDRVKAKINNIATKYENSEDIVNLYMKSKERLLNVEMTVIEEQIIELIYEHAKVENIDLIFSDVMNAKLSVQPNNTNT